MLAGISLFRCLVDRASIADSPCRIRGASSSTSAQLFSSGAQHRGSPPNSRATLPITSSQSPIDPSAETTSSSDTRAIIPAQHPSPIRHKWNQHPNRLPHRSGQMRHGRIHRNHQIKILNRCAAVSEKSASSAVQIDQLPNPRRGAAAWAAGDPSANCKTPRSSPKPAPQTAQVSSTDSDHSNASRARPRPAQRAAAGHSAIKSPPHSSTAKFAPAFKYGIGAGIDSAVTPKIPGKAHQRAMHIMRRDNLARTKHLSKTPKHPRQLRRRFKNHLRPAISSGMNRTN